MKAFAFEHVLRRNIAGIIAAIVPVTTFAAACGGTADTSDAGDSGGDVCNSCFCGLPIPPGPKYDVTYDLCPPFDADAATADASDDAGDADAGPPPVCYYDCMEACQAHANQGGPAGQGVCNSEDGDGGTHVAHCQVQYLCGRMLEGLSDVGVGGATALGETLARAAWLEAASIQAFRRLGRELRAHGAPRELVEAARACARDEARHARAMSRLAHAHGAVVPRVRIDEPAARDLEAIARENAVEGCVGETYGALLAEWQAARAEDAGIRAAMREIARDELKHAAFGWSIAAWADGRLSPEARGRVRAARDEAARALLQNTNIEPDASVARATGAPSRADAARLASAMHGRLWS